MSWVLRLAVMLWLPLQANAGAWEREPGTWFLSFGGNLALSEGAQLPVYYDPVLYAERGLTERVTLGFDAHTGDRARVLTGMAFARRTLGPLDGPTRWAVSGALGARLVGLEDPEPVGRLGLHWGRGLPDGWMAVDASLQRASEAEVVQWKTDLTWGHRLDPRWLGEGWTSHTQLNLGTGRTGDLYAKVSQGVIYAWRDDIDLQVSAIRALTGDEALGLNASIWWSF